MTEFSLGYEDIFSFIAIIKSTHKEDLAGVQL
jgi:hypothetical protein